MNQVQTEIPEQARTLREDRLRPLKELIIEVTKTGLTPDQIPDSAHLFDDCGLDSSSVVDLVLALEETYGIAIAEDQLEVAHFQSIAKLGEFVDSLKAQQGVEVAC
jgi:acyl carrier protein